MVHAEEICDHIIMIDEGTKVLDDTLEDIRRRHDPRSIAFEPLDPTADLSVLMTIPEIETVNANGSSAEIHLVEGAEVGQTIAKLATALPAARIEVVRPTLEDVFIKVVGRDRGSALSTGPTEADS
jgi:ABC-2 type transport system ATP-binding protein